MMKTTINKRNFVTAYDILNKQLEMILNWVNPWNKEFAWMFVWMWNDSFTPEVPDTNKNTKASVKKVVVEYDDVSELTDFNDAEDMYQEYLDSGDFVKNTYSEKSLYLNIGSVFKTKYIKDTQEELIALYKDEKTSTDDKKIISDILIYCNIPMVLNQVKAQMYVKWGEVNSKYSNIDEWDVLTQGILILKKSIIEYNSESVWKFKIDALESNVVNGMFEIKINNEKNRMKSVNLDFYKENFNKKESETLSSYPIVWDVIQVPVEDLPENFNINGKIIFISKENEKISKNSNEVFVKISYNKIKLITFITGKLRFGIQAYLLKSSGVKIAVIDDVIYNKIGYATKLYQRLSWDMVDYNVYEDTQYNHVETPVVNNDPYFDDYYNMVKKENVNEKISSNENPSLRWLAIFLLLNKKDFEIIKVDDKYDIFIKNESNIKNKDEKFKINYEKLIFTDKTEKSISKTIKEIEKAVSMVSSTNVLSFDMKIWDEDGLTLWDMLVDVDAEDYSDICNRMDNEKYISLLKEELENVLQKNQRISDKMRTLIRIFLKELNLEDVKKESENMIVWNGANSMFISFKRIFGIANIAVKEKLEKKYGKDVMSMLW